MNDERLIALLEQSKQPDMPHMEQWIKGFNEGLDFAIATVRLEVVLGERAERLAVLPEWSESELSMAWGDR